MEFDPTKFGATPVETQSNITSESSFDPTKFGVTPVQSTQTQEPPIAKTNLLQDLQGIGAGAIKGIGSTGWGLASLAENYIVNPLQRLTNTDESNVIPNEKPEALVPNSWNENLGYGVEQIAEFLLPASKIAKVEKGISGVLGAIKTAKPGALNTAGEITQKVLQSKLGGTIPTLAKAGVEATYAGGLTTAKEGSFNDNAKTAALVAGLFPIAGGLLFNGVKALKPLGEKIQMSVIRPTINDVKNGFKIQNVNKYNLGGSLGETLTKSSITMNNLGKKMATLTKNSNESVNLNNTYKQVSDALLKTSKAKQFGDIGATQRVLNNLKKEIEAVGGKNGLVNLYDATAVKRGAATKGAWAYGRFDPDSSATELIYDTFYNKLKTQLENTKYGPEIKAINKQLSEIIPVHTAALRRLPVEQRNNALSLTDSMGLYATLLDPKAMALVGANKLMKSGTFGKFLVDVGTRFKTPADPNLYRALSTSSKGFNEVVKPQGLVKDYITQKPLAQASQKEVLSLASKYAKKFGGVVSNPGIKSQESWIRKVSEELGGDSNQITDSARTSIINSKPSKIYDVLKSEKDVIKSDFKLHETNALGFQGGNVRIKTSNGIPAEIQVVSPDMVFAKESANDAKKILGLSNYKKMVSKYGDIGGKGHKFYEEYRKLPLDSPKIKEIEQQSKQYYSNFTKSVFSKPTYNITQNADNIVKAINENGGITYNAKGGNLGGKKVYSVAIYPERSQTFKGEVTKNDIIKYVYDNIDLLGKKGHSLGGWYDTESKQLWLDVAGTVKDKNLAIKLGKKFNQKAIFDLNKFEEISTGGTGEATGKMPSISARQKYLSNIK